jgi:hypothetical protein
MDLRAVEWDGVVWFHLAQERDHWRDFVDTVKNVYGYSLGLRHPLYIYKLNSVALIRERTMLIERPPLVGEVVPAFADRWCCVVSATDSHGR